MKKTNEYSLREIRWEVDSFKCLDHETSSPSQQHSLTPDSNIYSQIQSLHDRDKLHHHKSEVLWSERNLNSIASCCTYNSYIYPTTCQPKLPYKKAKPTGMKAHHHQMLQHEKWINLNWYRIILLPFTKPQIRMWGEERWRGEETFWVMKVFHQINCTRFPRKLRGYLLKFRSFLKLRSLYYGRR